MVEARITDTTIELFHSGPARRGHARSAVKRRHTTIAEHMPSAHRRYAELDAGPDAVARPSAIGPATAALVEAIMRTKPHPEQGFRACLGILRLAKSYGEERLEAACQRGLDIGAAHLRLGRIDPAERPRPGLPRRTPRADAAPVLHENIRGRGYYH